jgi:hypothetical protein
MKLFEELVLYPAIPFIAFWVYSSFIGSEILSMKLFEELVVYPAIPFIAFGFILHLLVQRFCP